MGLAAAQLGGNSWTISTIVKKIIDINFMIQDKR
jgi:hypothetical protein